jgi:hypothetical protein
MPQSSTVRQNTTTKKQQSALLIETHTAMSIKESYSPEHSSYKWNMNSRRLCCTVITHTAAYHTVTVTVTITATVLVTYHYHSAILRLLQTVEHQPVSRQQEDTQLRTNFSVKVCITDKQSYTKSTTAAHKLLLAHITVILIHMDHGSSISSSSVRRLLNSTDYCTRSQKHRATF